MQEQIGIFAVPSDVGGDERAPRDDPQAAIPDLVERGRSQDAAEALTLELGLDLGVQELDDSWLRQLVLRDGDEPIVQPAFEAALVKVVGDDQSIARFSHAPTVARPALSFFPWASSVHGAAAATHIRVRRPGGGDGHAR